MKRKLISLVLAFAFALSLGAVNTAVPSAVAASGASLQSTSSVDSSPAFRQYLKNVKAGNLGKHSGVIPSLNTPAAPLSLANGFSSATAPIIYDPRNLQGVTSNYLPTIRNQNSTGCCWAFGSTGCVDIYDGITKGTPILYSEEHMRFSVSKQNPAPVDALYGRNADDGGNFVLASAYMTNWTGMALDSAAPFPPAPSTNEGATPPITSTTVPVWPATKMSAPVVDHVMGTASIPMKAANVKSAIMKYGAVNVSIDGSIMSLSSPYYNAGNYASCGTSSNMDTTSAHNVDLVGWNDNFPTTSFNAVCRPTSPGAWLVRNSWGIGAGQSGYFWLSYQDASLNSSVFNSAYYVVTQDRAPKSGETMLSDDHLPQEARVTLGTTTQYAANTYQMTAFTTVSDVMLYSASVGATYSIYIVPAASNGTPSIAASSLKNPVATGTVSQEGYQTKTLTYPYLVPATGKYSVVVAYNLSSAANPGLTTEFGWTYPSSPNTPSTGTAYIKKGESSYASPGAAWSDLYTFATNNSGMSGTLKITYGNFCIRAITQAPAPPSKPTLTSLTNSATGPLLTWTRSKGATGYYIYRKVPGGAFARI
ncbi:MAG: lectin like domain-containing protein, partial [Coriobacteriia bacterium]|nr:lectin like domain-containing protein [Coriobacteriia bacterium]